MGLRKDNRSREMHYEIRFEIFIRTPIKSRKFGRGQGAFNVTLPDQAVGSIDVGLESALNVRNNCHEQSIHIV